MMETDEYESMRTGRGIGNRLAIGIDGRMCVRLVASRVLWSQQVETMVRIVPASKLLRHRRRHHRQS